MRHRTIRHPRSVKAQLAWGSRRRLADHLEERRSEAPRSRKVSTKRGAPRRTLDLTQDLTPVSRTHMATDLVMMLVLPRDRCFFPPAHSVSTATPRGTRRRLAHLPEERRACTLRYRGRAGGSPQNGATLMSISPPAFRRLQARFSRPSNRRRRAAPGPLSLQARRAGFAWSRTLPRLVPRQAISNTTP